MVLVLWWRVGVPYALHYRASLYRLSTVFFEIFSKAECKNRGKPCGTRDCGDKNFLKFTVDGVVLRRLDLTNSGAYDSISITNTTKGGKTMAQTEAQRRASEKWEAENCDRLTIKLNHGKGKDPSKAEIRAAAERDGLSVNAWIIEAIKERL